MTGLHHESIHVIERLLKSTPSRPTPSESLGATEGAALRAFPQQDASSMYRTL
jgi:hypothetical protein